MRNIDDNGDRTKRISGYRQQRVIVKLHGAAPPEDDVKELLSRDPQLKGLLPDHEGIEVQSVFGDTGPEDTQALMGRAREVDESYRPVDLSSYYSISLPPGADAIAVARAMAARQDVETAYVEGGPTPPPVVNPSDDPRWPNQGYLDPAPDGIDAEFAWAFPGGAGAGVSFVDLERGWTLNHEDLNAAGISIISGNNQDYFGHGTAVLGEVVGVDNTIGIVGIAPDATARVVSQWRPDGTYNTAQAILSAVGAMAFGDVLLLEAQTSVPGIAGYLPVEVEQAVFDAIRLATALGIVVVEAAGNGSEDLDAYSDAILGQILNRGNAAFRDSGALIVGAGTSAAPHTRMWFSNFGSRIDCFGWGENIDTTGDGWTGNVTTTYTAFFGGTSGASPIVAGAALAVQGMVEANRGYRFNPRQLRALLADPANGTQSGTPTTDLIGTMPDLMAIIQGNALNLTPDLYIRDFVGDTGEPHSGPVSSSPDIILRSSAAANPQAAFGQGSGTENSNILGHEAEAGQDNFIYVRALNQGGIDAVDVQATIFWSPVASLVTPDLWTLIGDATIANVPSGEVLTVSDSVTWGSADVPGAGHYCFIGILGNAMDPVPDPGNLMDWDRFVRFIRDSNNATWRNFNVVNNVPPSRAEAPPGFLPLPFLLVGAFDRARPMTVEITSRLPKGARVALDVPDFLLDLWNVRHLKVNAKDKVIPVNPQGRTRLREAMLPRKLRAPCKLLVAIPKGLRDHNYRIAVRQIYRKQEVGRVTWMLVPKNRREE